MTVKLNRGNMLLPIPRRTKDRFMQTLVLFNPEAWRAMPVVLMQEPDYLGHLL